MEISNLRANHTSKTCSFVQSIVERWLGNISERTSILDVVQESIKYQGPSLDEAWSDR